MKDLGTDASRSHDGYPVCLDELESKSRPHCAVAARGELTLMRVCAWCRRIQDGDGSWSHEPNLARLLSTHRVSHGICPHCAVRMLAAG
ncbi:hypothetical protein GALL_40210 [mine drainage metagenome]|uniref:Uncharacterized protein n=1 Tax=mine drainage metagenome TaxID=410659 RepID=A0A1J5T218_9ZZZZ